MKNVYIVSACRTPIAKFQSELKSLSAVDLGTVVVKDAVRRAGISKRSVEEVIMGNVLSAGVGQAPARQATIKSGCPNTTESLTVNKMCGSGMKALMLAANSIRVREHNVVIAGGMESMSNASYLKPRNEEGEVNESINL